MNLIHGNLKIILPVVMDTKWFVLNCETIQIYRDENLVYKLISKILEKRKYCNKIMKKSFEKELIITKEKEINFQMANKCHIFNNFNSEKGTRLRHKR